MIKRIKGIQTFSNAIYVEREKMINGMLIAFIARQHVLFVGVPIISR